MDEFTIKDLKNRIEGLPEDMVVHYQRIEDMYFEKHHWDPIEFLWETHVYGDEWSSAVQVFGCSIFEGRDGKDMFVLHAHY